MKYFSPFSPSLGIVLCLPLWLSCWPALYHEYWIQPPLSEADHPLAFTPQPPWLLWAYNNGFPSSPGLAPAVPLTVYAAAGTRAELPCHLPPGMKTQSPLTAQWAQPGGGPNLLVAGNNSDFTLRLDTVSRTQAGPYTCNVNLQGQQLTTTVTLAVITG